MDTYVKRRSGFGASWKRFLPYISLLLLTSLLFAACGDADSGAPASVEPVKVAVFFPLSGPLAATGQAAMDAAVYAVDEINAGGGIESLDGAPMEMVAVDIGSTPETASSAANRIVGDDSVVAGAGAYYSDLALAITEVTDRAGLPWAVTGWSDAITSRGLTYVFDQAIVASRIGPLMWDTMVSIYDQAGKDLNTVAIINDSTAYAVDTAAATAAAVAASGVDVDIVIEETLGSDFTDATPLAQRVRTEEPDLIFVIVSPIPTQVLIVNKFAEFGIDTPIVALGTTGTHPAVLEGAGEAVVDRLWTFGAFPGKPFQQYADTMQAAMDLPWLWQDQIVGYQDVWLVKEALEAAGSTDRDAIRDALANLNVTSGPVAALHPGGVLRFDENGRGIGDQLMLVQWQDVGGDFMPCTVWPDDQAVCDIVIK